MRRPSVPAAGISLFPFMAVLLCTMGALIVVLVVLNRQARVEATTEAATTSAKHQVAVAADSQEAALARDTIAWRLQHLATSREKTQLDLDRERLRLSGVEEHIRSLQKQLGEQQQALKQLENGTAQLDSPEARQLELQRLTASIEAARARLNDARKAAAERAPAYSVVPYDGPNRTRRRPIYIECTDDRVILQPEGIELTAADFDGPLGPGNPLASAVRAARDHLVTRTGGTTSPEAEPYPLFLVRPDGIEAYYAARAAMLSWGADFGYQTIDQDWKLEFPPADLELAAIERQAVSEARERLQWLAQLNPGRHRAGSPSRKVTYRMSPITGGLVREGGPSLRDSNENPLRGAGGRARGTGDKPNSGGADGEGGFDTGDDASSLAASTAAERRPAAGSSKTKGGAMDSSRDASTGVAPQELRYGDLNDRMPTEMSATSLPYEVRGNETNAQAGDTASEAAARSIEKRPNSLAESRGMNWGLAAAARSSNPITRPIHIRCEGDKLVLAADKSDEPPVEVPLTRRTLDSIDLLTSAVQDRIKSWGLAGRGMYWRPQLILDVGRSGEGRYADLEALLADSGFDVKRRR